MRLNILIVFALISCQQNRQSDNSDNIAATDSLTLMTLGQQEQASWDYYQAIEKMMKDEKFRTDRIDDYVQVLIDDGSIPKPEIFIETENGTTSRTVDYKTYKEYRRDNPIDLDRNYVFMLSQPDTLSRDSIRNNIIKALKRDTLN